MSSLIRAWIVVVILLSAACQRDKPQELVARAAFGIFFGGQVQEREEIPFQLDRAKQMQGFRLDFSEPLASEVKVQWEIDRPAPKKTPLQRKDPGRIVELGEATARKGLRQFDQLIAFRPGDTLGSWKVLVRVDDKTVIDRTVVVYDPATRPDDLSDAAP